MTAHVPVRVQPRARRDEIAGVRDGRLLVRVTAPPLEGRANRALLRILARRFDVPVSRVTVARGERARDKVVRVEGLDDDEARRCVGLPPA